MHVVDFNKPMTGKVLCAVSEGLWVEWHNKTYECVVDRRVTKKEHNGVTYYKVIAWEMKDDKT